jgi:hypothetical protein
MKLPMQAKPVAREKDLARKAITGISPSDDCCGAQTCAGACVCVDIPFVGRKCQCTTGICI